MSKAKVAPASPPTQAIRLKNVTVTLPSDPGDDEGTLSLTGEQLGQVLEWLRQTCRPRAGHGISVDPVRNLTDVSDAARELRGLGYIMRALGDLSQGRGPRHSMLEEADVPEMFLALGAAVDLLASRFIAADMGQYAATEATVTIAPPASVPKAVA